MFLRVGSQDGKRPTVKIAAKKGLCAKAPAVSGVKKAT